MKRGTNTVITDTVIAGQTAQSGFTLLEVLVALIVLSIGLLGLSGLQTTSLRSNHSASLRTQATILSSDIVDRMRANRQAAVGLAKSYDIDFGDVAPTGTCASSCSETQVAARDLFEWRAYVERLPGGQSSISVDGDGVVEVQIRWADNRNSDAAAKLNFTTRTMI